MAESGTPGLRFTPDVTLPLCATEENWPSSFMSTRRNPRASLIFSDRTQAVLYCAPSSRERCSAAFPLTAFTDIQIADKHLPEAELVEGEHGAGGD